MGLHNDNDNNNINDTDINFLTHFLGSGSLKTGVTSENSSSNFFMATTLSLQVEKEKTQK